MFIKIGSYNFESEIIETGGLVLLAFIHRDYEYKEQKEALEATYKSLSGKIKICLLDEKSIEKFSELKIEGSPTFIFYYNGREQGRILGKANKEALMAFVLDQWRIVTGGGADVGSRVPAAWWDVAR